MARPKAMSDESVLDTALAIMREGGPDALTFASLAKASGLSGATLVQRFGNKGRLKRQALLRAWDALDAETVRLSDAVPKSPEGAVQLLVGLTGQYGTIEQYAEGLLMLREDLRDSVLRARGTAWRDKLTASLDACFAGRRDIPEGMGLLIATHWQGDLLWWSFDPAETVQDHVKASLERFIAMATRSGRT